QPEAEQPFARRRERVDRAHQLDLLDQPDADDDQRGSLDQLEHADQDEHAVAAQVHTQAYVSSCAISTAAIHATSNIHARPRWIAQIRCRRRFLMRYEMRRIVAARNVARAMPGVSAAALVRCKCVRTALCLIAVTACAASSAELEKNAQRDN